MVDVKNLETRGLNPNYFNQIDDSRKNRIDPSTLLHFPEKPSIDYNKLIEDIDPKVANTKYWNQGIRTYSCAIKLFKNENVLAEEVINIDESIIDGESVQGRKSIEGNENLPIHSNEDMDSWSFNKFLHRIKKSPEVTPRDLMILQAVHQFILHNHYKTVMRFSELQRESQHSKVIDSMRWRPWEYLVVGAAIAVAAYGAYHAFKAAGAYASNSDLSQQAKNRADDVTKLDNDITAKDNEIQQLKKDFQVQLGQQPDDQAHQDKMQQLEKDKTKLEDEKKVKLAEKDNLNREKYKQEQTAKEYEAKANAMKQIGDALQMTKGVVATLLYDSYTNDGQHKRQVAGDQRATYQQAGQTNESASDQSFQTMSRLDADQHNAVTTIARTT